jgi:hypothetical protein
MRSIFDVLGGRPRPTPASQKEDVPHPSPEDQGGDDAESEELDRRPARKETGEEPPDSIPS